MKIKNYVLILMLPLLFKCDFNKNIDIPDENFKKYLLENKKLNCDDDTLNISKEEANNYKDKIDISGSIMDSTKRVYSIEGIKYFINLTSLNITGNPIKDVNISNNINLKIFDCQGNELIEKIDLTNNVNLVNIYLRGNLKLKNIDISKCINVIELNLSYCNLSEIDISRNIELIFLDLSHNKIKNIDLSKNVNLKSLSLDYNLISNIDLKNNKKIDVLYLGGNPNLMELDNLNNFQDLSTFNVSNSNLTEIDLSNNRKLLSVILINSPKLKTIYIHNDDDFDFDSKEFQKDIETNVIKKVGNNPALADNYTLKDIKLLFVGSHIKKVKVQYGISDFYSVLGNAGGELISCYVYLNAIKENNKIKHLVFYTLREIDSENDIVDNVLVGDWNDIMEYRYARPIKLAF